MLSAPNKTTKNGGQFLSLSVNKKYKRAGVKIGIFGFKLRFYGVSKLAVARAYSSTLARNFLKHLSGCHPYQLQGCHAWQNGRHVLLQFLCFVRAITWNFPYHSVKTCAYSHLGECLLVRDTSLETHQKLIANFKRLTYAVSADNHTYLDWIPDRYPHLVLRVSPLPFSWWERGWINC